MDRFKFRVWWKKEKRYALFGNAITVSTDFYLGTWCVGFDFLNGDIKYLTIRVLCFTLWVNWFKCKKEVANDWKKLKMQPLNQR